MDWSVRYRGRDGEPLTLEEWAAKIEDWDYKVLRQEHVGPYWISTVWLGFEGQMFETMVFLQSGDAIYDGLSSIVGVDQDEWCDLECIRYGSEAEALAGHAMMVEKWSQPR